MKIYNNQSWTKELYHHKKSSGVLWYNFNRNSQSSLSKKEKMNFQKCHFSSHTRNVLPLKVFLQTTLIVHFWYPFILSISLHQLLQWHHQIKVYCLCSLKNWVQKCVTHVTKCYVCDVMCVTCSLKLQGSRGSPSSFSISLSVWKPYLSWFQNGLTLFLTPSSSDSMAVQSWDWRHTQKIIKNQSIYFTLKSRIQL